MHSPYVRKRFLSYVLEPGCLQWSAHAEAYAVQLCGPFNG